MSLVKNLLLSSIICIMCFNRSFAAYTKEDLNVYVRIRPFKTSIPKILKFAKEMVDDHYFDAEIAILSSAICHPNYEGLSPRENVTMFIFKDDKGNRENLFIAKFDKNSPLKNKLMSNGLYIKDIKNWSFISTSEDELNKLSNPEWMIEINENKLKTDIEACPSISKLSENLNIDTLKEAFMLQNDHALKQNWFLFSTLRSELDDLRKLAFTADFNEESTVFAIQLKAKPGSNVGELFSSKAGGITELPQCTLKNLPLISSFSCIEKSNYQSFLKNLRHKILKNSDTSEVDIKLQELMNNSKELNAKFGGQSMYYSLEDSEGIPRFILICNGKYNNDHAKQICYDLMPKICATQQPSKPESCKYRHETVYLNKHENHDICSCACKNNLIITNSLPLIKNSIDNILENKSRIALSEGCVNLTNINLKAMLSAFDKTLLPADFDNKTIKPIKIKSNLSRNKCVIRITFDNASMNNTIKVMSYLDENIFDEDDKNEKDVIVPDDKNFETSEIINKSK